MRVPLATMLEGRAAGPARLEPKTMRARSAAVEGAGVEVVTGGPLDEEEDVLGGRVDEVGGEEELTAVAGSASRAVPAVTGLGFRPRRFGGDGGEVSGSAERAFSATCFGEEVSGCCGAGVAFVGSEVWVFVEVVGGSSALEDDFSGSFFSVGAGAGASFCGVGAQGYGLLMMLS